jgi:hypothetical protein
VKCGKIQIYGDDGNKSELRSEEIKNRLNSGNVRYHAVQILLSSHLLSKNIKIKLYETVILTVMYGSEILSLTLGEEHTLRVLR